MKSARAHIIVVGNAKGGCGKSTTAMHIVGHLLSLGRRVAIIDLDGDQATLGRYIENRRRYVAKTGAAIEVPQIEVVAPATFAKDTDPNAALRAAVDSALEALLFSHEFVVLDCPGSNNLAARMGHAYADTLVTPINDSFVDFDLLAHVDPDTNKIVGPSWYSEMVWEQRKKRYLSDGHEIDWIVMRNRHSRDTHNRRKIDEVLRKFSMRIGFRVATGLAERVVFRELFLKGLTLSDVAAKDVDVALTMSLVAARAEVREMVAALKLREPAPNLPATDGNTVEQGARLTA